MKLAWFSPLSQKSAIARFSTTVLDQLSKIADVDVICFDEGEIRETQAPVKRFSGADAIADADIGVYDAAIYNLGNHLPFHREIYLSSRRWPGICILHDLVMHHFFAAYYREYLRDPGGLQLLLDRTYGSGERSSRGTKGLDNMIRFPLFEEAVRGALGVITHSTFLKQHVESCFSGPVARISLAYDARPADPVASREELAVDPEAILIVTVGHINPNKQIEMVIDALTQLDQPSPQIVYAVLGSVSDAYRRELQAAARVKSFEPNMRFLGEVPDRLLSAYLSAADICVNLRFPVTEGASASVIEEMMFGKPVIVNDTGFFSELPDDCVVKIRPGRRNDLASALGKLVGDASGRERLGARAKAFAQGEFRADNYARRLVDFVQEVQSARPMLGLSDRVGVELSRMGVGPDMEFLDGVAHEIHESFLIKRT